MDNISKLEGSAKEFAIACYDTNSIAQLDGALEFGPDETDCRNWDIDADEWTAAVKAARADLIADQAEDRRREWAQRNGNDSGYDPYAYL